MLSFCNVSSGPMKLPVSAWRKSDTMAPQSRVRSHGPLLPLSRCSCPQHGHRCHRGVRQLPGVHDYPGGVPDPGRSPACRAGPGCRQRERDGLGRLRLDHHREPHGGRRGRATPRLSALRARPELGSPQRSGAATAPVTHTVTLRCRCPVFQVGKLRPREALSKSWHPVHVEMLYPHVQTLQGQPEL